MTEVGQQKADIASEITVSIGFGADVRMAWKSTVN